MHCRQLEVFNESCVKCVTVHISDVFAGRIIGIIRHDYQILYRLRLTDTLIVVKAHVLILLQKRQLISANLLLNDELGMTTSRPATLNVVGNPVVLMK